MTLADGAIVATTALSTPIGILVVLQALENQRYTVGFLKLVAASSPIGLGNYVALGDYFIDDPSPEWIVGCWSTYCLLLASIVAFEASIKARDFFRNRIEGDRYTRNINIEDFER